MRREAWPRKTARLLSSPSTSRPALAAILLLIGTIGGQHPSHRFKALHLLEPFFNVGSGVRTFSLRKRATGLHRLPDAGLRIFAARPTGELLAGRATGMFADW